MYNLKLIRSQRQPPRKESSTLKGVLFSKPCPSMWCEVRLKRSSSRASLFRSLQPHIGWRNTTGDIWRAWTVRSRKVETWSNSLSITNELSPEIFLWKEENLLLLYCLTIIVNNYHHRVLEISFISLYFLKKTKLNEMWFKCLHFLTLIVKTGH